MSMKIYIAVFVTGVIFGSHFYNIYLKTSTHWATDVYEPKKIIWLGEPKSDVKTSFTAISPCPTKRSAYVISSRGRSAICYSGFVLGLIPLRLGNTLMAIANMLFVAKQTGSKAIFPTKYSNLNLLLANNATSIMYDFRHKKSIFCSSVFIKDNFFASTNRSIFLGVSTKISLHERTRLLRTYFKPHMQITHRQQSKKKTLVVHIRSGDIMRGNGAHRAYVQPPLAFYQKIILDNNFTNVIVVCEDHNNPTVDALAEWSNIVTLSSGSIREDIDIILSA